MKSQHTATDGAPWQERVKPGLAARLRSKWPWFLVLALILGIGWGMRPKPVRVEVAAVVRAPLTVHVSEEGRTRIRNRYVISAPVSGRLARVTLRPGDQVLAEKTVVTSVHAATAAVLDQRSQAQAQAALRSAEAAKQQAQAVVAAKSAAHGLAEAEWQRVLSVRQAGSLSQSDRDRVRSEVDLRKADLRAAEFAARVAEHEYERAQFMIGRVGSLAATDQLDVSSPVSGVVLRVMQESESVVAAGTPIVEVGDPADLEVEAEILSRDAVGIRPGDPVEFVHWGGNRALAGKVRRVEPSAFTKISALGVEEQRVLVLCDFGGDSAETASLGDRYRVEVRIAVWHQPNVLTVPSGALFREGNAWKTYRLQQGRAVLTQVEVGRSDGRHTQVLAGLAERDVVLLHPPDNVRDGTEVEAGAAL